MLPSAYGPLNCVVGINLNSGADGAMLADLQSTGAIQHGERAYPCIFPHLYITQDQRTVVDAAAFAKARILRFLPKVDDLVTERQAAVPVLTHMHLLFR